MHVDPLNIIKNSYDKHHLYHATTEKQIDNSKVLLVTSPILTNPQTSQIRDDLPKPSITPLNTEDETLLQELNQILQSEEIQIEKELKFLSLENDEKIKEVIDSLKEGKNLITQGPQFVLSAKEKMKKSFDLLRIALPIHLYETFPNLFAKLPPPYQIDKLSRFGNAFLISLEYEFQGLSLIYKTKILNQSRELLQQFQAIHKSFNQIENLQSKDNETQSELSSLAKELNEIFPIMQEWEAFLKLEEKLLADEKLKFKISTAAHISYLLSVSLNDFPGEAILEFTKVAAAGIPLITSSLGLLVLGLELKKSTADANIVNKWTEAYKNWENQYQYQYTMITKDFKEWQTQYQPKFNKLNSSDIIIQTSKNLLEKRKQIVKDKVAALKPKFETVEEEIKKLKKDAFIQDMQQLFWQEMRDPNCSPQVIMEQFKKWGFYESQVIERNLPLFQAHNRFERNINNIQKDRTREDLIKEFQKWMEDPNNMDQQFQAWYNEQSIDRLLEFYVDHQETIEFTKKSIIEKPREKTLDIIVQTTKKLLEKREEIRDNKVNLLKTEFHKLEPEINDLKKKAFIQDMQQLLWEKLQNPKCSPEVIEQKFKEWGFNDPKVIGKNKSLFQALNQFTKNPNEKENLIKSLIEWMGEPGTMENQFQVWFDTQSKNSLLEFYVDQQETIESTIKNPLKQMVQKKHEIESRFIHFKRTKDLIHFNIATIAFAATLTLALLGLLSIPFGGIGLIIIFLSIGTTLMSLGLFGAGIYLAYKEKPNITQTLTLLYQAKLTWARIRVSMHNYMHKGKEKKQLQAAKILHMMHQNKINGAQNEQEYQKTLKEFNKAKLDFENNQKKIQFWANELSTLEANLTEKGWQDFAMQASLQTSDQPLIFDTLKAFQEALQACDLRLLSEETKTLLTTYLGIDLETLQNQIQKNPEKIKKSLQEFFALDDANFISFIRKANIKMGFIQSQAA